MGGDGTGPLNVYYWVGNAEASMLTLAVSGVNNVEKAQKTLILAMTRST